MTTSTPSTSSPATRRARMRTLLTGLAAALALSGVGLGALPSVAGAAEAPAAAHTNREWARLVLTDGGWPTSTNNVTVLLQWMASEEPVSDWYHATNPLNNGAAGGDYTSLRSAAHYVVQTLGLSYYVAIRKDLNASASPPTTAKDIQASRWSTSHYGYGSAWRTSAVPTTDCPASYW